jgi:hypothetical protein
MSRTVSGARRHSSAVDAMRNAAALSTGGPAIAVSAFGALHASKLPVHREHDHDRDVRARRPMHARPASHAPTVSPARGAHRPPE